MVSIRNKSGQLVKIKGVVFDMDGTLTISQPWMFKEMRSVIGLTDPKVDILTFISQLSPEEQTNANLRVEQVEEKAMREMQPQLGLLPLLTHLQSLPLPMAILTRNLIKPVTHLLNTHIPANIEFNPILTRSFQPPKPKPDALFHIAENWGVKAEELIMVGDSMDDMNAGYDAGAVTVLIKSVMNGKDHTDVKVGYVVESLEEIIELLEADVE
ncbi:hypothetical protein WICPIJ_009676 [Wickerhamomyces pijperi]|uniref:HAD superfamily hydrolase n=1 Tax=Wickerhamomyces pijperi TaxID=599730 RepID=A0A9P8PLJ6_WICPI|nr:hypothetical protein WICPIJ_009676 [Wickerhamomyces pijperi]